jgi:hypothetical protein
MSVVFNYERSLVKVAHGCTSVYAVGPDNRLVVVTVAGEYETPAEVSDAILDGERFYCRYVERTR